MVPHSEGTRANRIHFHPEFGLAGDAFHLTNFIAAAVTGTLDLSQEALP